MRKECLRIERVTTEADQSGLVNFSLHLFEGEILGVIFVDEQGKRELVRLVMRNTPVHYGMVYCQEALVNSYRHSPLTQNGVTVIDNQNRLVDSMTVADNVFVLRPRFKKYVIETRVLNAQFERFAAEAGVNIRGGAVVGSLSLYQKCVVQLLKAAVAGHKLVIVQDISNIVSAADLQNFHGLMRHFARQGMAFLYVCSHHEEVRTICDRMALVEDGQVQRLLESDGQDSLFFQSYYLNIDHFGRPGPGESKGEGAVSFSGVHTRRLQGIDFSMERGECLILLDANNTVLRDFFNLLKGEEPLLGGRVAIEGRPLAPGGPRGDQSVGFIEQSPVKTTLFPDFSYLDNLCFLAGEKQPSLWRGGRTRKSIRGEYLPLVGPDIDAPALAGLSASSLYNLVYYRQHLYNPKLLVVMQPFYEADMYLRRQILSLIDRIRKRGAAVLLLSVNISDSPVLADRMLVLEQGRLTREYGRQDMERLNREKGL